MSSRKADPEIAPRFPIKLDSTTNGEYAPKPLSKKTALALQEAERASVENARKMGISRREFVESTCGAASVLLAMNQLHGCAGGSYKLPPASVHDREEAKSVLEGDELIFDVQTHHVAADRMWWESDRPTLAEFLVTTPQARCEAEVNATRGSTA